MLTDERESIRHLCYLVTPDCKHGLTHSHDRINRVQVAQRFVLSPHQSESLVWFRVMLFYR